MITVLIAYALLAAALMMWATFLILSPTLQPNARAGKTTIDYVVIPSFLLSEWAVCYPDLLVFDVRESCETEARQEQLPGSLCVSTDELPNLLRWLPPQSTIVLAEEGGIRRLPPAVEDLLAERGIDTVYFLDRTTKFPQGVAWNQFVHRSYRNTSSTSEQSGKNASAEV